MVKRMIFPRWRLIAFFLMLAMFITGDIAQGKGVKKTAFANIDRKLKAIRKTALKSIQSSDGDVIDCVSIYNQPAFDHPALKNHTIQMRPSFVHIQDDIDDKNESSSSRTLQQTWQKSGRCPEGTIPIRRVRKQDLLRYDNLERFGMKSRHADNGSYPDRTLVINNTAVSLGPRSDHSYAMLVATVFHFIGARGSLNVWNPSVASWEEYTTSQIWLQAGNPDTFASVEVGWIVNKKLYGDTKTRLFTYWTSDGSHKTGCFDLICSGFVQTSSEVALGAAINPVSSRTGGQYVIQVQISMDDKTGNWWLVLDGKINVGYWPKSLFGVVLGGGATLAQWGGEVYSQNVMKSPHTTTLMGSGEWAEGLFGYASYIEHIRVLYNPAQEWVYPQYVGTYVDEKDCYSAFHYVPGFMKEPTLFFGGPGQNPRCP